MRVLRWASRFWTDVLVVIALLCGLLLALRLLLPLLPASPPLLAASTPINGARDLAPQQPLTLQFSTPMNPRSVERAVRIAPLAPLAFRWNSEYTSLTLTPMSGFTPATSYTLTLDNGALSRWFQPLDRASLRAISFQVAPAPEVFALFPLPGSQAVAIESALSIGFSRPMVDAERIGTPQTTPLIQFDPPLETTAIWVDASTLLVQPRTQLRPATRYSATVDPSLVDLKGIKLDQTVNWSFATAAPVLLALTPADGATAVAPRTPLVLHLSQPFDQAKLAATLAISPTITGRSESATLPDATAVFTFTPETGWAADTRYQVTLAPGFVPLEGNLPLAGVQASFRTAPQPVITGRFPGAGQVLPPGQAVRLIFNTPVDEAALRQALNFEPPVENPQIAVNGNIAQISAAFAPATVYTATLAPLLTDLNGVALGQPYQLRFQTAPAPPTLALPEAAGNVVQLAPGTVGPLLRRANLRSLAVSVYLLDQDTAVRLLNFNAANWRDFDAERAGLTALRSFSRSFTDTLNVTIDERLVLTDTGALAPGAYYLRLRGSDNLRAGSLLFMSATTLSIRASAASAVVWATDQSGAAVAGANLSLYRDGTLLERGQSDSSGLWRVTLAQRGAAPLVAISSDGGLATTAAPDQAETLPYRAALITDAARYQPGDTVQIAGVLREAGAALPPSGLLGTLALRSRTSGERIDSQPVRISGAGVISGSLVLPRAAMPGSYVLSLGVGSQLFTHDFTVAAPGPPALATVTAPPTLVAGTALTATIQALRGSVLPLASATVSWTVGYEPLTPPDAFSYGTAATALAPERRGVGTLDANGQLALVLSDTLRTEQPLRYWLDVQVARPDIAPLTASASGSVLPAAVTVAARSASQIATIGEPFDLELLTQGAAGPLPDAAVTVELLRFPAADQARPAVRELTRSLRSDATGRATIALTPPVGGLYQVVASVVDSDGRRAQAVLPIYVTAAGFGGWPAPTGGVLPLVSSRARYQPGDVATLLIPAATKPGAALVTVRQGQQLSAEVRQILPGGVFTVPIGLDPALVSVEVLLRGQASAAPVLAATTLPVAAAPPFQLALAERPPTSGLTTTLVLTATDSSGQPRPATVALAVTSAQRVIWWQPQVQIGATGILTLTVPLPEQPGPLVARANAVDAAGETASAEQTLAISRPLELALDLPPLLRIGDAIELQARLRNTSAGPQQATLRFAASGLTLLGAATPTVNLAPGATAVITAAAQVDMASVAEVQASAQLAGQSIISAQERSPVELAESAAASRGALASGSWSTSFAQAANQPLLLAVAPSVTALARDEIATLAAEPARSASDSAALLQLTAPLTTEQTLAQQALTELLRAELPGGGWAWQSGAGADTNLSLFALEGLAAARKAGLVVPDSVVQRTLALFGRESGTAASARLAYATALGGGNPGLLDAARHSAQSLNASELALLLLARSANPTRDAALIDALLARLAHDESGFYAASDELGGDLAATALAAQALAAARPTTPALPELRRFLVAAYSPNGWPNGLVAARVIAALHDDTPAASAYTVTLSGSVLADFPAGSAGITMTQRLVVPPAQLPFTNTLTIRTTGGAVVVGQAYGLASAQQPSSLHLLREYLDPASGASLDITQLRPGQLVLVRLTVITRQSVRYLAIEDAIPAGCLLVETRQGAFSSQASSNQISFQRALLEPGVYQQRYLLQIATAGRFTASAPVARTSGGTLLARGNPAVINASR